MACYVDEPIWPFRGMMMCHLLADELDELHSMASRLGLKREWFQESPRSAPHYDIAKVKRKLAVTLGAVEIDCYRTVEIVKQWRGKKIKQPVNLDDY